MNNFNGAVPLFLMKNNATDKRFISNNPHEIVTLTPYSNPYTRYLNESWNNLNGWSLDLNQGIIEINGSNELHLTDTSGNINGITSTNLTVPDLYRIGFDANISSFGQAGAEPLMLTVTSGSSKLKVKFGDGTVYIRNGIDSAWLVLKDNIPVNEWHNYEWELRYNKLNDYYTTTFFYDGVRITELNYKLLIDSSAEGIYLHVKGDTSGIDTVLDELILEDAMYRQLSDRVQYRAYDGSTSYLGFLGYAMPEGHTSTTINYINLNNVLTDSSYYSNPEALALKVIESN